MKHTRTVTLSLVILMALLAAPAAAEPQVVMLRTSHSAFAINSQTGDMAAIDPKAGTVTLYSPAYLSGTSTQAVGPVTVGKEPQDILFKRYKGNDYFIVTCKSDTNAYVLMASNLRTVRKIPLAAAGAVGQGTSLDESDPLVYYGNVSRNRGLSRFSLATFSDQGPIPNNPSYSTASKGHAIVSADGRFVYPHAGGYGSSTTPIALRHTAAGGGHTWELAGQDRSSSTSSVCSGPMSVYCATDRGVYTADMKTRVAELKDIRGRCFFANRPVLIGTRGNEVVALSWNTFGTLASVSVPSLLTTTTTSSRTRSRSSLRNALARVTVLPDAKGERVVLAYEQKVCCIPLKDLGFTGEPFVHALVTGPREVAIGTPLTLELKPVDPKVKVKTASGLRGMSYVGNRIRWIPTGEDVGRNTVIITVAQGQVERSFPVDVNVSRPSLDLPIDATSMAISPSGDVAVVWSGSSSGRSRFPSSRSDGTTQATPMAVIDLKQQKVVATASLPIRVRCIAIDDRGIYISPADADAIDTYGLQDLKRKRHVLTQAPVSNLETIGNGYLLTDSGNVKTLYKTATFETVDLPVAAVMKSSNGFDRNRQQSPSRLGSKWLCGGVVFQADLTKASAIINPEGSLSPMRLTSPSGNPSGMPKVPTSGLGSYSARMASALRWNRVIGGGYGQPGILSNAVGQRLGNIEAAVIDTSYPIALSCEIVVKDKDTKAAMIDLVLADIATGTTVKRLPLAQVEPSQNRSVSSFPRGDRSGVACTMVGRNVHVAYGRKLYTVALDAATLASLKMPFHIPLPDTVPVISPSAPTRLTHKVVGGKLPVGFSAAQAAPEVSIDSSSGTVTVNGPALVKRLVAQCVERGMSNSYRSYRRRSGSSPQTPDQRYKAAVAEYRKSLKEQTGLAAKGVPMLLQISVTATDAQQQAAAVQYYALVDLPEADIISEIQKQMKESEKERLEAELERKKRIEEAEARRTEAMEAREGAAGEGDAATKKKIEELEKRVEELEAKIDLLLKLLKEKNS